MTDTGYLTSAAMAGLLVGKPVMVNTEGGRRIAVMRNEDIGRFDTKGATDVLALMPDEVSLLNKYAVHEALLNNGNRVTLMVAEQYAKRLATISDMEVRERILALSRWCGFDEAAPGGSWTVLARIDTLEGRVDALERRIDSHQQVVDMNRMIGG